MARKTRSRAMRRAMNRVQREREEQLQELEQELHRRQRVQSQDDQVPPIAEEDNPARDEQ